MTVRRSVGGAFALVGTVGVLVLATPAAHAAPVQGMASWTYYGGSLGACGVPIQDSDLVAAVSPGVFGTGSKCGSTYLLVTGNSGQSVKVRIADECKGCTDANLNLTPAVFQAVGYPLGLGHAPITWDFTAGP